ncbi:cyclic nucleotide-binding domain-containing protein [Ramlibacter ginsenosidimutans]|uniref:Cyclic nucleotide-binding domain-containing protein n=1 Tax=Ramlibacter ginsenosidimutans TaxID=502333 RepID=A0A934TPZ5_9BURK|nr:cyclic nucleotide-binding domain-containing protein [Ramlibacter ginsenosidimutans]MBK6005173.1 cyclic nucleotide-binding domain-containing protein [Ramlibacter ginsenosidimutans]
MLHTQHQNLHRDTSAIAAACRRNRGYDSTRLTAETWELLSSELMLESTTARTDLIREGENDGSLLFLESGLLRVYCTDKQRRLQLAVIAPGSIVGEGGFFAPSEVRTASVEAIEPSTIWRLTRGSFEALTVREPEAALSVALYAANVMRARMLSVAGRLLIV